MKKDVILGIDIGGTNIDYGFVNNKGEILFRSHMKMKDFEKIEDFIDILYPKTISQIKQNGFELKGIGIGAPNSNYYHGTIEYAPNLTWKGIVPAVALFKEKFNVPVFLTNDANAATIGEMIFGGAKGIKDFIYITLGTGVGSGIVVNGQLVYGHDGFAGEIGHFTALENGRLCGCGRRGCLETYSSVTGLRKSVDLLKNDYPNSKIGNIDFERLTGKMIHDAAETGDELALKAFDIAAENLGKVLANVVTVTSPKAIFLFGGLANAENLIFDKIKNYMENNLLFIFKNKVKIMPSKIKGNEAAIKGAAALAWNEINQKHN